MSFSKNIKLNSYHLGPSAIFSRRSQPTLEAAMQDDDVLHRITADPGIFGGKPVIRGMRMSVELVSSLLAQGLSRIPLAHARRLA